MIRYAAPLPTLATTIQSLLFVPGNRPERFAKALASGADLVCIDLEDAVPADAKIEARVAAMAVVDNPKFAIRINGLTTREGLADLLAIAAAPIPPALLLIPKVESPHEIIIARQILNDPAIGFIPLIESAKGLGVAQAIAEEAQVVMMMFGGADFASELGVALAWEPLLFARSQLVMACAAAGVPAMDVPYIDLDNVDGLKAETQQAKALGFAAKAAIHPAQIETLHNVLRPSTASIAEALEARAAFAAAGGAAVKFKGKMLEAPIMRRYEQLLVIGERISA